MDTVAIINHDTEKRTLVSGCENPGCYHRLVTYTNVTSVEALIDSSISCRQFIKIECHDMTFWSNNIDFGWLEGRGGKKLPIWGGGQGRGCACGLTNSCHNTAYDCNCDSNANLWLKDEGYIESKSVLPITGISLGDTGGSNELGYHTLGKLECVQK